MEEFRFSGLAVFPPFASYLLHFQHHSCIGSNYVLDTAFALRFMLQKNKLQLGRSRY